MPDTEQQFKEQRLFGEELQRKMKELEEKIAKLEKPLEPKEFIEKILNSDGQLTHLQIGGETLPLVNVDTDDHGDLDGLDDNDHGAIYYTETEIDNLIIASKVLDPTPDTDHSASGLTALLTAGTALVAGQVCYQGSDGKMEKGDADAVATAFCWAIALATIADNAEGSFALPGSFVRDDSWSWATKGQPVYLDTATPGGLTQTAPSGEDDVIQIIGIAYSATVIYFYPQLVQVEYDA